MYVFLYVLVTLINKIWYNVDKNDAFILKIKMDGRMRVIVTN